MTKPCWIREQVSSVMTQAVLCRVVFRVVIQSLTYSGLVAAPAGKPNLLLIFADDIGYEALNCYGGLDFKTPRLDAMAKEGIRFSRMYTSPVCTPSRVSLHTGLHTNQHRHTGVLPVHKGTKRKVDFCELSGTKIPGDIAVQGKSIAPQIHGQKGTPRKWTHQGLKDETVFDGSWRLFRKSGKLVDARKLPAETTVDIATPETETAKKRLEAIFESFEKLPTR